MAEKSHWSFYVDNKSSNEIRNSKNFGFHESFRPMHPVVIGSAAAVTATAFDGSQLSRPSFEPRGLNTSAVVGVMASYGPVISSSNNLKKPTSNVDYSNGVVSNNQYAALSTSSCSCIKNCTIIYPPQSDSCLKKPQNLPVVSFPSCEDQALSTARFSLASFSAKKKTFSAKKKKEVRFNTHRHKLEDFLFYLRVNGTKPVLQYPRQSSFTTLASVFNKIDSAYQIEAGYLLAQDLACAMPAWLFRNGGSEWFISVHQWWTMFSKFQETMTLCAAKFYRRLVVNAFGPAMCQCSLDAAKREDSGAWNMAIARFFSFVREHGRLDIAEHSHLDIGEIHWPVLFWKFQEKRLLVSTLD